MSVVGYMSWSKVALIWLATRTPVRRLDGFRMVTVGGTTTAAAAVLKLHDLLAAKAFPARSLTPVEIVAV